MEEKLAAIYSAFDGKLVGNRQMKQFVCETVANMPQDIISFVTENCWFLSSMEDAWAFTFTGNDLANQHLIFLSDELLHQNVAQIHYSIAHEIGHVFLGHKNAILVRQTKNEIKKQEAEADEFALKYIR